MLRLGRPMRVRPCRSGQFLAIWAAESLGVSPHIVWGRAPLIRLRVFVEAVDITTSCEGATRHTPLLPSLVAGSPGAPRLKS